MTYPTTPPIGTTPRDWAFPTIHRAKASNGITLMAVQIDAVPIVHVRWCFRRGRTTEPANRIGIARLVSATARHGTQSYDSQSLAHALDQMGARMHVGISPDNTSGTGLATADKADDIMALLAEALLHPTFPDAELERERRSAIEVHRHERHQPDTLAGWWMSKALYGEHPYGWPGATMEGLESITPAEAQDFHSSLLDPAEGLLVAVGDFDPQAMLLKLEQQASQVQPIEAQPLAPVAPDQHQPRRVVVHRPNSEQVTLSMGSSLFSRNHPDYMAMRVVNQVLGSGASSRFFRILREQESLSYSPYSTMDTGLVGGDFGAGLSCAPDKTKQAASSLIRELRAIREAPIEAGELTDAIRYLTGSFPQKASGVGGVASLITTAWMHGLPEDTWSHYQRDVAAIDHQTAEDTARRWIDPDRCTIIAVGPRDLCQEALGDDAIVADIDDPPGF